MASSAPMPFNDNGGILSSINTELDKRLIPLLGVANHVRCSKRYDDMVSIQLVYVSKVHIMYTLNHRYKR